MTPDLARSYLTLDRWGLHPEIRVLVGPYLRVIALGAPAAAVLRVVPPLPAGACTSSGRSWSRSSRPTWSTPSRNWLLIYGNLGFPALGVEGSAWATTAGARLHGGLPLRRHPAGARAPRGSPARCPGPSTGDRDPPADCASALPAASQITLEVGVFAAATALAGKLDPVSSGAHQIALNIAGAGVHGAARARLVRRPCASAMRLAPRRPPRGAARAGPRSPPAPSSPAAIGVVLFLWPTPMLRAFTTDVRVIRHRRRPARPSPPPSSCSTAPRR